MRLTSMFRICFLYRPRRNDTLHQPGRAVHICFLHPSSRHCLTCESQDKQRRNEIMHECREKTRNEQRPHSGSCQFVCQLVLAVTEKKNKSFHRLYNDD
jgi:hypothetical protein